MKYEKPVLFDLHGLTASGVGYCQSGGSNASNCGTGFGAGKKVTCSGGTTGSVSCNAGQNANNGCSGGSGQNMNNCVSGSSVSGSGNCSTGTGAQGTGIGCSDGIGALYTCATGTST